MTFFEYLTEKKYSARTVATYDFYRLRFLHWLKKENLEPGTFTYTELLDYLRDCEQKGVTKNTIKNMLGILRHYCSYLNQEKKRTDNPAAGVFIKGMVQKLPSGLLSFEELEVLYSQYSIQLHVEKSKKIMFGLMVYQAVSVSELTRIGFLDIDLREGKIKIKGTKKTNERILGLHASQMILIQQYLAENKCKQGALLAELIRQKNGKYAISNRIKYMLFQLRQLNAKLTNAKQIRSSVITHWLKQNNLRQVQYMAGHKYVSSTERYQLTNLDDLQQQLGQHHPMS